MSFPALAVAVDALAAACAESGRPPEAFDGLVSWMPGWPSLGEEEERGVRIVVAGELATSVTARFRP